MATVEELEEQLAVLKNKRAAVRDRRDGANRVKELERQLEQEEIALKDEEAIEKAELEHGLLDVQIKVVRTDRGCIIVKRPPTLIFRRFQELGRTKTEDYDRLVRPCVVYPTKGEFDKIIEELPATLTRCADAVAILAGVRIEEVAGK